MTAVEWLMEQLTMVYPKIEEMKLLTDKAKAMEKEIIRKAYLDGTDNEYTTSEEYYNENYKSE